MRVGGYGMPIREPCDFLSDIRRRRMGMTGGYGTPIQETCSFCRGKLTHKCMVNPVQISREEGLDAFGVNLEERDLWVYLCDPCFSKVFAERSKQYKKEGNSSMRWSEDIHVRKLKRRASLIERLEDEIAAKKAASGRCWPAPKHECDRCYGDPLIVLLQDALDQIRSQ